MTIKAGEKVPSVTLRYLGADGMKEVKTDEFFKGKKAVIFGVPGAFTPTCSAKHLPSFLDNAAALKAKGVDIIACVGPNDAFVMDAWGKSQNAGDKVMMLADGSLDFAKAAGLELDMTARGLGVRSQRYAMVIDNGVVKSVSVESNPGALEVSGGDAVLKNL